MTPERWQEVKIVLAAALERKPSERLAYLDAVCAEPSLRAEVESLIAAHEQGGSSFLDQPAAQNDALKSGTKLGSYEIVALLGTGVNPGFVMDRLPATLQRFLVDVAHHHVGRFEFLAGQLLVLDLVADLETAIV